MSQQIITAAVVVGILFTVCVVLYIRHKKPRYRGR